MLIVSNLATMVDGKMDLLIEYQGKLYAMASQEQYQKFLSAPWKYVDLSLPKKLPPPKAPLPIGSLPVIGYLEQTVATLLTEGLAAVGKFKPKHPYKDLNESARLYLAYYLKAHNPRHSNWIQQKYKKRLAEFESNCQVIQSLVNAFHRQDNVPQSKDFDQQFERLLQLNQRP
jgi:adenylate/nucleoside-diphosphate kinase